MHIGGLLVRKTYVFVFKVMKKNQNEDFCKKATLKFCQAYICIYLLFSTELNRLNAVFYNTISSYNQQSVKHTWALKRSFCWCLLLLYVIWYQK